jgi:hypothetical protein
VRTLPLALLSALLSAYVNPAFTPLHLEGDAEQIFIVKVLKADNRGASLEIGEILKGKPKGASVKLDFSKLDKDAFVPLEEIFKANGSEPGIMIVAKPDSLVPAVLHIDGKWLKLKPPSDAGVFEFDTVETNLNTTFHGATDMLIGTFRFIKKYPGTPIMMWNPGVNWEKHDKIGRLPGEASALCAVDVDGDGKLDLHASCPKGDKIFLQKNGKFEELSSIPWATRAAVWADFDGDGRLDCAASAAEGLTVYFQTAPVKFAPKVVAKIEAAELAVIDIDADGRPDIAAPFVVLKNKGGEFEAMPLPEAAKSEWGTAGPFAAADFDGDGIVDIVQFYQKDGVFYRGKPDGTFTAEPGCGAAMGNVKSRRAAQADLDHDGTPEVILFGAGSVPGFYLFKGGKFHNVMDHTGEPSYQVQPSASVIAPGDFNNDSFVDFFVGNAGANSQVYYNRGFRSFGLGQALQFPKEGEKALPDVEKGQSAAIWADFDGGGCQELACALTVGDVYVSQTTLSANVDQLYLNVKVPRDLKYAGPINVKVFFQDRCLGGYTVDKWVGARKIPAGEPGAYTVKWRLPGQAEVVKSFTIEPPGAELVIGK